MLQQELDEHIKCFVSGTAFPVITIMPGSYAGLLIGAHVTHTQFGRSLDEEHSIDVRGLALSLGTYVLFECVGASGCCMASGVEMCMATHH